jgi:hypothetical protein
VRCTASVEASETCSSVVRAVVLPGCAALNPNITWPSSSKFPRPLDLLRHRRHWLGKSQLTDRWMWSTAVSVERHQICVYEHLQEVRLPKRLWVLDMQNLYTMSDVGDKQISLHQFSSSSCCGLARLGGQTTTGGQHMSGDASTHSSILQWDQLTC